MSVDLSPSQLPHYPIERSVAEIARTWQIDSRIPTTISGFDAANWFGVLAPRGTPDAVVTRLAQDIAKAMQADDVKQRFIRDGGETIGGTPAAFAELMRAETKRWAEVVRGAGMRVD